MIPFNCSGFSFDMPGKWADITLRQFYSIRDSDGNWLTISSILSGIPREAWEQSPDVDIREKIEPYLSFLQSEFDLHNYFVSDYITIEGRQYKIPKDIRLQTAGQKWHIEDVWKEADKNGKTDVDCFAEIVAIYMQPTVTGGTYDADKVDQLIPKILDCHLEEVWPLASFFLDSYVKSLNSRERLLAISLSQKRYERGLTDLESSETLQHFSAWRRFLIKVLKMLPLRITTLSMQPYISRRNKADIGIV